MTRARPLPLPLLAGRAHEVSGPASVSFALQLCQTSGGRVVWIREAWRHEAPNPVGMAGFADVPQMIFPRCQNHVDVLAASEEALRTSGVCVVTELSQPLDFRQGRRLQLAAEAGGSTGLFIIAEGAGSNAAETRWRCAPVFDEQDSTTQRWELKKNKSGTLSTWMVRWDAAAHRFIVVSEIGEQQNVARLAD